MMIPVRGAMAYKYMNNLYVFGGCKGPKEHIAEV